MNAEHGQEQPAVVEFAGGPMDGHRLDVTGWSAEDRATGVAHITEHGAYGPGGDPMAPVWHWEGDTP